MEDKVYKLKRDLSFSVPIEDADKLISFADGDSALLYLYMLRDGGVVEPAKAAAELRCNERDVEAALDSLRSLGLLDSPAVSMPPSGDLPEYDSEVLVRRSESDGSFKFIVSETERVFGRLLSSSELKTMFAFYDHLALPCEVILMLINYCVVEFRDRYGEGRLPTMRQIEKEAYIWSDREILTLDWAEEYIRRQAEKKDAVARVKSILQIVGRELSQTERKYVDSWIEMGFQMDAIESAYDRTIVKTGKLQWKYMDSILSSWHGKGLHTLEEVNLGDRQPSGKASGGAANSAPEKRDTPQKDDLERMRRIRNKIRNS